MLGTFVVLATLGTPCEVNQRWVARRDPALDREVALTFALDRSRYVVGEPLQFSVTLTNTSSTALKGYFENVYGPSQRLRIEYRRAGGSFGPLDRDKVDFHGATRTITLPAGKTSSGAPWRAVDRGRNSLILDQPGSYEFRAVYCESPGDLNTLLTSKVVAVTVDEAPDGHRDAWRAYSPDIAQFTHWMRAGHESEEVVEKALDFVERFPDSPWASKVRRGLLVDLPGLLVTKLTLRVDAGSLRERCDALQDTARRRGELREDGSIVP